MNDQYVEWAFTCNAQIFSPIDQGGRFLEFARSSTPPNRVMDDVIHRLSGIIRTYRQSAHYRIIDGELSMANYSVDLVNRGCYTTGVPIEHCIRNIVM